jgi:hypothetical protein
LDHSEAVFLYVWLAGILIVWPPWIWASINSRRRRGEPLIPRASVGSAFCERAASGRAYGNILGNAHNCLMVAVTGDELWITPTLPFNMIAPYGLLGLEYRVSKDRVTSAERRNGLFGSKVVIEIKRPNAPSRTLEIRLKDPDAFLAALRR